MPARSVIHSRGTSEFVSYVKKMQSVLSLGPLIIA